MARRNPSEPIENLSREERRRLRVGRYRVGGWKREKRRRLSRDELLDYLRRNGFKSRRQLVQGRKPGDPHVWDYVCEFGRWSDATLEAFGKEPFAADFTAKYIVRVVAENNLWTAALYREERRVRPDIVPSFYQVEKEYKRWENLKYAARQYDARRTLHEYLRLMRRYGRRPTAQECKEKGIDVRRLVDLFGGRKRFNENVLSLRRHYEK